VGDDVVHPFRNGSTTPRTLALRLVGRSRIVDSIVIPFIPLVGVCIAGMAISRRLVPAMSVSIVALVTVGAILLARMLRPCVLVLEPPYRVLRWTHPTLPAAREIDLDDLVEIGTDFEPALDTSVTLVAFVLKDGRRVRLFEDTNLAFGAGDARRLTARIVAFLESARRDAGS
jgi:hypothetical protein